MSEKPEWLKAGYEGATPSLEEFRAEMEKDNNTWWALDSGHHLNLYEAAIEALDAAQVVPQPDRTDLREVLAAVLSRVAFSGSGEEIGTEEFAVLVKDAIDVILPVLVALSPAPLTINREELAKVIQRGSAEAFFSGARGAAALALGSADAVISHLSAQTVEGEVEWEYNIAYPETTAEGVVWWNPDGAEPSDSIDIVRDWLASGSYLDSDRIVRRRKAGPWIEVQS